MLILYIILGILAAIILWIAIDIIRALSLKPIPDLPDKFLDPSGLSLVYYYLTEPDKIPVGLDVDEQYITAALAPSIEYINKRYDCADFRCQLLFRLYKDCNSKLPESVKATIKKTFIEFKYWMDEPGSDSMCFWSENHQLLFAVSEYLAGQEWPGETFSNNGMTGAEHMDKAIKRINIWMEQKFKYGFYEWCSNNYYAENIAPMANYIEYSRDLDSVSRMKIIMDLLWYDVASHSVNNTFVSVSSRMYGDNKSGDVFGNRIRAAMDTLWGAVDTGKLVGAKSELEKQIIGGAADLATTIKLVGVDAQMMQNFIAMHGKGLYKLPKAVYNVMLDKNPVIIKSSSGLNTSEFEAENLIGQNDNQIMAQMGMEAFTNPEVVGNTLKYLSRVKMFRNIFVSPFRYINIKFLRLIGTPKRLSKRFDLMTNGVALQRGNVYCYRTADYALTTAMAQNVDACGAQGHIWSLNIAPDLAVYTTHPARDDDSRDKHAASPGYWVGNGRQPMSVQDKNVNITIYKIPVKKRPLEFHIADITHVFLPKEKFDELEFEGNYIFGRRGKVLMAMMGSGSMEYRPCDTYAASLLMQHDKLVEKLSDGQLKKEFDLVMKGGEYHAYVTEVSDVGKETYAAFKARIKSNKLAFLGARVEYVSQGRSLEAVYAKDFKLDGIIQNVEYKRFDSPYSTADRKPDIIKFSCGGSKLSLDYRENIRIES